MSGYGRNQHTAPSPGQTPFPQTLVVLVPCTVWSQSPAPEPNPPPPGSNGPKIATTFGKQRVKDVKSEATIGGLEVRCGGTLILTDPLSCLKEDVHLCFVFLLSCTWGVSVSPSLSPSVRRGPVHVMQTRHTHLRAGVPWWVCVGGWSLSPF